MKNGQKVFTPLTLFKRLVNTFEQFRERLFWMILAEWKADYSLRTYSSVSGDNVH
jgi:hypothetical protein